MFYCRCIFSICPYLYEVILYESGASWIYEMFNTAYMRTNMCKMEILMFIRGFSFRYGAVDEQQ